MDKLKGQLSTAGDRRDWDAESKCPINRREVFEGNGYCYIFEPQEGEE